MIQPTTRALEAFAGGERAERLTGGMGTSWRAGDVVLKPSPGFGVARCLASTHTDLPNDPNCRFQRPIPTAGGEWEVDGWTAWGWVDGEAQPSRVIETLRAARAYHGLLRGLPCDRALIDRDDPWARADRVAWDEVPSDYGAEFDGLLDRFRTAPPALEPQRVHGDLTGNVVLSPGLSPGIIDATLYWRPPAFAEAIVLVDQSWFSHVPDISPFAGTTALTAMVRVAARRRIAEQPEQMRSGKDRDIALRIANQIAQWTDRLLEQVAAL